MPAVISHLFVYDIEDNNDVHDQVIMSHTLNVEGIKDKSYIHM